MAEESNKDRLARAYNTIKNLRQKGEKGLVHAMHAGESAGTAFALGVYEGYHGEAKIANTEASLVVGIIAHAAALSGAGSEAMDGHFAAIGNGALSVAAFKYGQEKGQAWKSEKDSTGDIEATRGARAALASAEAAANRLNQGVQGGAGVGAPEAAPALRQYGG